MTTTTLLPMTLSTGIIQTDDKTTNSRKKQQQQQQLKQQQQQQARGGGLGSSPIVALSIVLLGWLIMVDLSEALLSSRRGETTRSGSGSSGHGHSSSSIRIQEFRPSSTSTFFSIRPSLPRSKQSTPVEPQPFSHPRTIPYLVPSQVRPPPPPRRVGGIGQRRTRESGVAGVGLRSHDHPYDDGGGDDGNGNYESRASASASAATPPQEGGAAVQGGVVDSPDTPTTSLTMVASATAGGGHPNQKRNNNNNNNNNQTALGTSTTTPPSNPTSSSTTKHSPRRSGNLPDIYWRSIPIEDLRHHPQFHPLPPPEHISRLETLEDIRFFQQGSWQWDAVHEGRCTTSQTAAALGFLEPKAASFLGVPRSWQKGGVSAYFRLRKPALRTLEEMNAILCGEEADIPGNGAFTRTVEESPRKDPTTVWQVTTSATFPFAAKYMVRMTPQGIQHRKELSKRFTNSKGFASSVRMMWGTAQEPTSLLTALNYFWQQDNGVILKEVGMCGGGLDIHGTKGGSGSQLLVGATPDALLYYPDGTVEALEVKNHCPFFSNTSRQPRHRHHQRSNGHRFSIRGFDFSGFGVPPQYIPQLMMEMFCVGETCRSAVMVRQTATSGALILRIRRDDEWIDEMIYWLRHFKEDFVDREEPPPTNFFLEGSNGEDCARYMAFLEHTKTLQDKVEVVAQLTHAEIQRATGVQPGRIDLFLD